MATTPMNRVIQHLVAACGRDGMTDGELLTRFLSGRDEDALAALIGRHGPMVWGVCCRVLRHPHDAEDAFQATFLVLVQKAATLPNRETVGNWLHGVARQTAVRMRAFAAKRGLREKQVAVMPEPTTAEQYVWNDLSPVVDEELSRLPNKYRALIVLCDLEGVTRKEVARRLDIPEGTAASRLAAARAMLAKRLARRGIVLSGVLLGDVLCQQSAWANVPALVVSNTRTVASLMAAGKAAGVISGPVTTLTQGVLKTMFIKKIMTTTMAVLALGVTVILGGSLAVGQTEGTGKPSDKPPASAEKPMETPPTAAEKPLVAKVAARDVVVNTPTILGKLQGEWELQPKVENEYKQRVSFTTGNSGSWQRSEGTLPVTITYYVEGQELLIQHNYEPNGAFNYRLKQLRFEYAISNDKSTLTLTAGEKTQTWKRIPKANPKQEGEKMPPEKEAFTAWGKEVGGLQAGLGLLPGAKRDYQPGETVTLVVRVRNVSKQAVKFEYVKQFLDENRPTVTNAAGKAIPQSGTTMLGIHGPTEVSIEPGKEVVLETRMHGSAGSPFALLPESGGISSTKAWPLFVGTGKVSLHYDAVFGNSSSGKIKLDPDLAKFATGKLELEVKDALPVKQKVLTPAEAIKVAGDGKLAREFNESNSAVEFKVEFVTKAIQVKASGEKDAAWGHGHSPDDICLGTLVPTSPIKSDDPLSRNHIRFVATLTEKAIKQFNKAGITDLEKHFKGKTVRVTGTISWNAYDGLGSADEVEIVLDDMSQLEVVK